LLDRRNRRLREEALAMSRIRALGAGPDRVAGVVILVVGLFAPLIFNNYWVGTLLTQMLIFGIVAASLIFLSAYGGMVSLAQVALFGVAGFALGNMTTMGNTKGLNLAWEPWLGVVLAIAIATVVAIVFGALSSRSFGIYFLMITLTLSVIANLFFGQVVTFSGFGGISGIPTPAVLGTAEAHPDRLYYVALGVALAVYFLLRYIVRTPFGLALQGIRDDPLRMSSLGYHVALHRTIAFAFAGLIAGVGGVLFAWWNGHIDPATIDLGSTIDVLVIAVIGGLLRLEGAWLGALVFVVINNYSPRIGFIGDRFHTLIGAIFLVIVLLSPAGLMGLWERAVQLSRRGLRGGGHAHQTAVDPRSASTGV
jgi:branched-chain amino acid transport system permease protein